MPSGLPDRADTSGLFVELGLESSSFRFDRVAAASVQTSYRICYRKEVPDVPKPMTIKTFRVVFRVYRGIPLSEMFDEIPRPAGGFPTVPPPPDAV